MMEMLLASLRRRPTIQHPSESVEFILPWHKRAQTSTEKNFSKTICENESHLPHQGHIYVLLATLRGAYLT
jgi:hypothetical protein